MTSTINIKNINKIIRIVGKPVSTATLDLSGVRWFNLKVKIATVFLQLAARLVSPLLKVEIHDEISSHDGD